MTAATTLRWQLVAILAANLLVGCLGCSAVRGRGLVAQPVEGAGDAVALYRARMTREGESDRRFRLWLFAARPDRIHAEALSPLGTTHWIVDGGAGQLAVTAVRERITWAGDESPAAVAALLGLELSLTDLVDAVLGAEPLPAAVLRRTGTARQLPERLVLRTAEATLDLRLDRHMWVGRPSSELGTGRVPPDAEWRPLEDLPRDLGLLGAERAPR